MYQEIHPFKIYNSAARRTLTELYNCHLSIVPQHFHHPKVKPVSLSSQSTCSPPSAPQFSRSVMSNSLQPHGLQEARPPCLSPTPGVHSNSCPSRQCCHPTISSSVIPFSSCLQSFPASGSFPMSRFFALGGQSIGASVLASVLPMNIQDRFPSEQFHIRTRPIKYGVWGGYTFSSMVSFSPSRITALLWQMGLHNSMTL